MHQEIMTTAKKFMDGISALGFQVLGKPDMSIFAYNTPTHGPAKGADIYVVADLLEKEGWHVDRQLAPECIHLMITPAHTPVIDQYLKDLKKRAITRSLTLNLQAKEPPPCMVRAQKSLTLL